jgi:hypothetical protein
MLRNSRGRLYLFSLFLLCVPYIKAMEDEQWDQLEIDSTHYTTIKAAIFTKKGQTFAEQFDKLYPQPCKEGVIALAKEFDRGSCKKWLESCPPQSYARIDGKYFKIVGAIADIIYENQ